MKHSRGTATMFSQFFPLWNLPPKAKAFIHLRNWNVCCWVGVAYFEGDLRIFPFDKTVNIFILCHIAKYIIEVCNTTKICFCYPFVRILDSGRFRIWNKISALFGILWRFLSENCGRVYVYQALQATKDKLKSHRCNELEKNGKVIQPHLEMHTTHIMEKNG